LGFAAAILPQMLQATDYQRVPMFSSATVLAAALAGEHTVARTTLDRLMSSGLGATPIPAEWLCSMSFLAHACAVIKATQHAADLAQQLINAHTSVVKVGPMAGWWARWTIT
jgi:hypothetical protein